MTETKLPNGHRIEERAGSFQDLLPAEDVVWAYGIVQPCQDEPAASELPGAPQGTTAIPPDARDHHLFYRDATGTLQGVLTYSPQGFCDLRWMRSRAARVGSRLFDDFVARAGEGIIACRVIAECESRQKVEHLLHKHGFRREGDSDDWTRSRQGSGDAV